MTGAAGSGRRSSSLGLSGDRGGRRETRGGWGSAGGDRVWGELRGGLHILHMTVAEGKILNYNGELLLNPVLEFEFDFEMMPVAACRI